MTAITEQLIVETGGGVGRIIFNNPDRRNAMTFEMWRDLPQVLADFADDASVRVIIISGTGDKAFCAGADISQFKDKRSSEDAVAEYNAAVQTASDTLAAYKLPTIAKIRGYCVGGGVGIAICCDLRIASDDSRFAVPAAKLGLGYRIDGLQRLVDVVGPAMSKEIFFTARQFDATEAAAMGLVNRVLPVDELDAYVDDYATRISENAPLTIHAAKVVVGEALKSRENRDLKLAGQVVDDCFDSNDYAEGRQAFMEKRKPNFQGN